MGDLYAPLHNPDFQEGASIEGDSIATLNDLADLRRFLLDLLGSRIQELVFNNGSVIPSGGAENVTPVTALNNKISIFMAPIRLSYLDATYADGVAIPVDISTWTLASSPVQSADIRQAAFTQSTFVNRVVGGPTGGPYTYGEITTRFELQADKKSYLVKFDLKIWMNNPANAANGEVFTDTRLTFSATPDDTMVNQTRLTTVLDRITSKRPNSNIYRGALRFDTAYYALAVKP